MTPHGTIRVDRRTFVWEVRDERFESLPSAEEVLIVRTETGRSELVFGLVRDVKQGGETFLWIGPVFVRAAEADVFPSLDVGRHYLLPTFRKAKTGVIDGEDVRSVVARLLSGRRLRRVEPGGEPMGWTSWTLRHAGRNPTESARGQFLVRFWLALVVAAAAAGTGLGWYFGKGDASFAELALITAVTVTIAMTFWGILPRLASCRMLRPPTADFRRVLPRSRTSLRR